MHFACLVKQACVDLVSDLFVYYRLGCEPFVSPWGLQIGNLNGNLDRGGGGALVMPDPVHMYRKQTGGGGHLPDRDTPIP